MGFPPTTFIKLKRWGWVAESILSKGIEAAGKQVPAPDLKMEPQTRWVDPERFWQRPDPRECGLSDKSDGIKVTAHPLAIRKVGDCYLNHLQPCQTGHSKRLAIAMVLLLRLQMRWG